MPESELARALQESLEAATPRTRGIFGGDNAMSAEELEDFLREVRVGLVSTVDPSGAPHVAGVGLIILDGRLYFGPAEGSALYRHLQANPHVAIGVMEPPWTRQALIQGAVRFLSEDSGESEDIRVAERAVHGWESDIHVEVVLERIFTWME